ncbi:MAG: TetR family transcriptional regulator C-terminal domain-containing protein [Rhodobacteraceae bacterium]|nr:TetR family transcriptional regulator C-terminal domain-containing protein [Paracoccaceae bacterium]
MTQSRQKATSQPRAKTTQKPTRIQREKTGAILEAALEVFSKRGFRGATLDMIAEEAQLSKPNLLYYFASKEALHSELLAGLLEKWLKPLADIEQNGDPIDEIKAYIERKLELAEEYPRESRLFANEVIQEAPRSQQALNGHLKTLVKQKAAVIQHWIDEGRIARVDPYHLIFSIWATTQHYADFDTQIRAIMDEGYDDRFTTAKVFLSELYTKGLRI